MITTAIHVPLFLFLVQTHGPAQSVLNPQGSLLSIPTFGAHHMDTLMTFHMLFLQHHIFLLFHVVFPF